MFDNIGGKIKMLAKVFCWVGIGLSVLVGLLMMIAGAASGGSSTEAAVGLVSGVFGGLMVIVIGSLSSWIGSFVLYGFGELIERTTEIARNTRGSSDDSWRS